MINSLTNEKIKRYAKLNDAKGRKETGLFLVEGPNLVEEAKMAGVLVEVLTTLEDVEGTLVSDDVMKKLSQTKTPVKVMGVCKKIDKKNIASRVLILDDVSDPTNMGTILRSAKSFGFDTVFATNNSVDFYNDKVIRGSQGAIFKLNLITGDIFEFINDLKKTHLVYGTNVRNGIDVSKVERKENIALIMGNEKRGVKEEVQALADSNIYIKLNNMESLNVSVAASILMYELDK